MGNVAFACNQVVTFVIDHKWVIISILVVLVILGWVCLRRKSNNVWKVIYAGLCSIILGFLLLSSIVACSRESIIQGSVGFWNLIILIISAPVAFAIWHFRDENNRQQIENQRKDINLKEFQKLSEWVSGAHLPEIKTVSKTTNKCNLKNDAEIVRQSTLPIEYTTEETEEYSNQPKTADFDTFSKRDGAVALQISAIYNLLPFFRGDYGESFRLPAFNLLKSAWQAMQQDSLKKLEKNNLSDEALNRLFNELEQKANSPMGVALTQVLLSLNRENTELNLRNFREILPNICLAGMNFHLSGVDEIARDLSGLKLQGAKFHKADLTEAKLKGANLGMANFQNAILEKADLETAILLAANLHKADLTGAKLKGADLRKANFQNAILEMANLETADLFAANLHKANLTGAKLKGTDLRKANFQNAILEKADLETATLVDAKFHKANLTEAKLKGANLGIANFQNAILVKANLETAILLAANLHKANLTGAKLKGADLRKANFQNACLVEADLQNANLSFANLKICDFKWEQLKDNKELLSAKITIYDFIKKVYPDWKKENDPEWEALTEGEQMEVMQNFQGETGMLIFDKSGTQIMPPPLGK